MYTIDPRSALPVYQQLKRQIRFRIASGWLSKGEKLPSIRELALILTVNPNTVLKAYNQLEYEGFVVSRAGSGVFVSADRQILETERHGILGEYTAEYVASAVELGFTPGEILEKLVEYMEGGPSHDQDQ